MGIFGLMSVSKKKRNGKSMGKAIMKAKGKQKKKSNTCEFC